MSEEEKVITEETLEDAVNTAEEKVEEAVEEAATEVKEASKEVEEEKEEKGGKAEKSKSALKREARKAAAKKDKRKKAVGKFIETAIGLIIAGLFIAAIVMGIYTSATKISPDNQYSYGLTEEGYVEKADLSKVKDLEMEKLVIMKGDVDYTDDKVETDITNAIANHAAPNTDPTLEVADGDEVNIDFVGYIDGEAFEGGDSQGQGYNLTIGSHSFIDDFEEQLIGSHPGDNVTVEVTFPEDYASDPSKAGQDATFEVTVNSITTEPELNDEFVQTYYGDYASTPDELRDYFRQKGYDENLTEYIENYISENASVSKMPRDYLKNVAAMLYYAQEQNYETMNSYYQYYYGYSIYTDFFSYVGMDENAFQKDLKAKAKDAVAEALTYEKILRKNNLSVSEETYNDIVSSTGMTAEETFGKPYLMQVAIKDEVVKYLKDVVTVQ